MPFTIVQSLELAPSYALLCGLAGRNQVQLAGTEIAGTFSSRGVEGNYEFAGERLHGEVTGFGVKGRFEFEAGKLTVTITDKPFWMPEMVLKKKVTEGLAALVVEVGRSGPGDGRLQ